MLKVMHLTMDASPRAESLSVKLTELQVIIFIIRLTRMNVLESMGKPCSCTQSVFFITSHMRIHTSTTIKLRENPYQVLQVMCAVSECAMRFV